MSPTSTSLPLLPAIGPPGIVSSGLATTCGTLEPSTSLALLPTTSIGWPYCRQMFRLAEAVSPSPSTMVYLNTSLILPLSG
ncbi:hypothetical protein FQZ97_933840 [compost metagenome]